MMKKAISLMLALVLVVSLCGSALAATVSPSVNKTTVAAGESVDVTLTLSEKLENIYGLYYYLSFDEDQQGRRREPGDVSEPAAS